MSISRVLTALLALVVLLVATAAGGLFWLGKRAEPIYDGEVALAGLTAPVSVRFGPHAVPSIAADSIDDLLYAQGYVVASERLWQMDLLRRLAGGRLAEVFGEAALPADRFYRTMGLPLAAREAYAALEPEYRRMLERYADGVNAYRRAALERPPLEYLIAGFDPAPWAPEDSLVIGEYMAWINSVNLREELIFLRLAGRLGNRLALELFPADVGIPAPAQAAQLPDYRALAAAVAVPEPTLGLAARLPVRAAPAPGIGASNVWAVNGPRGEGGHALLANDPHLAPSTPGIWYELELSAPGYHAAGVALPGVPLILIGHNQDLAWGMTTVTADTQDLFLERMTGDGEQVLRAGGGSEPIQRRVEQIPVKGRAEPVELIIERTSHGVLIDDLVQRPRRQSGGSGRGRAARAPGAAPQSGGAGARAGRSLAPRHRDHRRPGPGRRRRAAPRLAEPGHRPSRRQHRLAGHRHAAAARARQRHLPGAGLGARLRLERLPAVCAQPRGDESRRAPAGQRQ